MRESFSTKVKVELTTCDYNQIQKKSILAGITRTNSSIVFKDKKINIVYRSEIASVSKFIYNTIKELYQVKAKFTFSKDMHFNKATIYYIIVEDGADDILRDLEIRDGFFLSLLPKETIHGDLFHYFVKGMFISSGMITNPNSPNYYLEFALNSYDDALFYQKRFSKVKYDESFDFKISKRRNKILLYLKKSDQISLFLAFIGASIAMLDYEDKRVIRDYFNSENRLQICTTANYERAKNSSQKQMEDIKLLDNFLNSKLVDKKLVMLASLRLENPDSSMSDLALLMGEKGIQISKSGVNHLFKKLNEEANKIREKENAKN